MFPFPEGQYFAFFVFKNYDFMMGEWIFYLTANTDKHPSGMRINSKFIFNDFGIFIFQFIKGNFFRHSFVP